jgi:glutamyl-tRNA reductase
LRARGNDADAVLDALARALTQKMLHGAYAELNAADPTQREQMADAVSRLFLRQAARTPNSSSEDSGPDTAL